MFDGIHSWYLFRAACDCLLVPPAPGPLQAHPARYLVGGDQEELKAFPCGRRWRGAPPAVGDAALAA